MVADMDADGLPSPGDITHPVMQVVVPPKSRTEAAIDNLNVLN